MGKLRAIKQWRIQAGARPLYFRQNILKSPLNWLKFVKKSWGRAPETPGAPLSTDPGSATVKGAVTLYVSAGYKLRFSL